MRKDCMMEDYIKNPRAKCQQDLKHNSGNKRKALAKNKSKVKVWGLGTQKTQKAIKSFLTAPRGRRS